MLYYASCDINDKYKVTELVQTETAIVQQGYVPITEEQYTNGGLVGKYYNQYTGNFDALRDEWSCDTSYVQSLGTNASLEERLVAIEEDVSNAATTDEMSTALAGKANATHGHNASDITGLADVATSGSYNDLTDKPTIPSAYIHPASHPASMIEGLATVATSGSYNDLSDKPTIPTSLPANGGNADTVDGKHAADFATATHNHDSSYAAKTHSHSQSEVTGLGTALSGKADASHTHSNYALATDVEELETAVNGKAESSHTHAQSDITGLSSALSGKANTTHSHVVADVTGLSSQLDSKADVSHTHTAYADASHTHDVATTTTSGFMSKDDKSKLNGIEAGANAYTHPTSHPASMITGLSEVATSGDYNDLANKPTSMSPTAHIHAQSDITGLASALSGKSDVSHTHSDYALASDLTALSDTVDGKANSSHSHSVATTTSDGFMSKSDKSKLNGVESGANKTTVDSALSETSTNPVQNKVINTALSGKANSSHTHTLDDVTETTDKKIMTAAERTKLSGIATGANKTTVDTALSSTSTNPVQNKVVNTALGGKVDKVDGKGLSTNDYTTAEKNKLAGIAAGANAYTHPSYTAKSSGLYKVTVDATGHVSEATAVAKSDITALGIPSTNTTYSNATQSAAGLLSASDKTKLDGIETGANKTVVDSALSSTSTNPVQNKVVNTALSGKANTSHTHTVSQVSGTLPLTKGGTGATTAAAALANLGVTATAAELNKMDGVTATTAELNYVDGVTSNIQTQLNGKAASGHNHNSAYIAKSLQMTADDGDVYVSWTNQDVIAKIKALTTGMYTAYAKSGTTNNPKSVEAWRFMVHKTGVNYGWVMAFGSFGSVYTGYVDNGNWQGWRCIFDVSPAPLWTGKLYMSSPNSTPQTVTPSKKLSECRNGWLLLWSDYDKDTSTANDSDFVTTMIPKKNPSGGNWGGKAFYCDIPRYIGSDVNDVDTERRIIKSIYIHDDCIKGSFNNDKDERNDVVLRAVYEY